MEWQRSCLSSQTGHPCHPDIPVRSLFTSPQALAAPGPRSSIPQLSALGVTMGWGGLAPLPPAWSPRTTATDGDLTLPTLGQTSRGNGLAASRCWQSLQPPVSFTGACGWGCSTCPTGNFCFRCPLGKKNIGSLSCRRWHEEATLLLSTQHVQRPWLPGSRGIQHSQGFWALPCIPARARRSHNHVPHLLGQSMAGPCRNGIFQASPPAFGKISLFLCWMGRGP